jgi:hypothetical protein
MLKALTDYVDGPAGITHPKLSALSNCQASLVSLPVRPNLHPLASALGTLHAQAEGRNLDLVGAVVKANDCPVQAPEGELAPIDHAVNTVDSHGVALPSALDQQSSYSTREDGVMANHWRETPGVTISHLRRQLPYRNAEQAERLWEGLRKAGLQE